ncbi:Gfo/Idh/MocA family oxidoreductase [Halobacteria archaeon AArc-m2/3/4]|uniref:Gfo/Idh/MocA family oxidoreductase n=1 Tax=Natronoglomus mannanivorans TaxID=2979990 RepID=A0ABT2QKB5_9EURY|nr:Gfo/Idh/MocA family oxidoreductase [Halobacteria archaeon AArc-m2/3/4]
MTVTDPVRYGIVGVAGIGDTHANAVERASGVELVACADLDEDAGTTFAAERDCQWYPDAVEMIREGDVDAVSVCTPSGTHANVAIDCMEAGAHVLCEKPLDVYRERMDAMVEAADETGRTLAGVFQRRTYPAHRRAREAVVNGELGRLVLGTATVKWYRSQEYYDSADWRGTRAMDGGCLLNQSIHAIDLLQWIAGGVAGVYAKTDTVDREMECENVAVVVLEFENGAVGTIEATTATQGGVDSLEINGTRGSYNDGEFAMGEGEAEDEIGIGKEDENGILEWGEGHARIVQDFVDAIREGREPMVPAREARAAVDLILAIETSADRGEWIDLEAFRHGEYD